MSIEISKLDNPVWYSLTEAHKDFAIECKGSKFYHPDYCPFGGFINRDKMVECIDQYSILIDNFFVVGHKPDFQRRFKADKRIDMQPNGT